MAMTPLLDSKKGPKGNMAVSASSARPVLSSATLLLIGVGSLNMQTTELFRTFQDVIVPEKPAVHCSKHSRRL